MSKFAIVDRATNHILHVYEANAPQTFGGPWGRGLHIQIPDTVSGANVSGMDFLAIMQIFNVSGGVSGGGSVGLFVSGPSLKAWKQQKNKIALDAFSDVKNAQSEVDLQGLLAGVFGEIADYPTYLMIAMDQMDIALNISGTRTSQEIADAKTVLAAYRASVSGVQVIRSTRDSDIANFVPPYVVSPLYP